MLSRGSRAPSRMWCAFRLPTQILVFRFAALTARARLVQNRGQGLGFVMGGMVVDRKTLVRVTASLLTGTFSLFTYIYGFMDDHTVCGGSGAKLPADSEGSLVG